MNHPEPRHPSPVTAIESVRSWRSEVGATLRHHTHQLNLLSLGQMEHGAQIAQLKRTVGVWAAIGAAAASGVAALVQALFS